MAQTLVTLDSQIGGITWNRDDVILFASNEHGLRYVSASGGPVTTVTERDASLDETYHDCPVFLPDGRRFLYLAYSETKPETRAVYVGSLDSNARTRLMTSDWCVMYAKPGFLVFPQGQTLMARPFDARGIKFLEDAVPIVDGVATNPNGEVAAFDVSDGGTLVYRKATPLETTSSLIWADRNGKISDPVGASIQPGGGPTMRLSPDEKRVAFNTGIDGGRDDIWVLDFERNVRIRLTSDPTVDHVPVWSPDGSRLIFDSHRRGKGSALYEIPSDGAVPERVLLQLDDEAFIAATDWSRDGRFLVFHKSASAVPHGLSGCCPSLATGSRSRTECRRSTTRAPRCHPMRAGWLIRRTNRGCIKSSSNPFIIRLVGNGRCQQMVGRSQSGDVTVENCTISLPQET